MKQTATGYPRRGFRDVLRDELARRCSANGQYSLRAFARDLGIDHSSLSQILRGRRSLTEATLRRLAGPLGLPAGEVEELVEVEQASPGPAPAVDPARVKVLRELSEDLLAVVADPEHMALLELTHLDSFQPDVRWIARVLGLEVDAVNVILQRLLRLGLLVLEGRDEWIDLAGDLVVPAEGLEARLLQRIAQRLQVRTPPGDGLEYSSTVLSVDSARVKEVGKHLARCRNEILALLGEEGPRDAVYRLELAFVPLTRETESKEAT